MRRQLVFETLLIVALLSLALSVQMVRSALAPLDAFAYDRMLPLAAGAASADILIVAIDEASLRDIGRWPWRRSLHAQLLRQLALGKPKAVFLDIFLTDISDSDQDLARAMAQVPTFLPLLRSSTADDDGNAEFDFVRPTPVIAASAQGIGHTDLVPDRDGVARTLYLRQGPPGGLEDYVGRLVVGDKSRLDDADTVEKDGWLYQSPLHLAFSGPRGTYSTVSYIDVLKGEISPDLLRGRLVLVGATAPGLGDQVLTPTVSTGGILSGVEVHANAIDNLLGNRGIRMWPAALSYAWTLLLLWAAAGLLLRFERYSLPVILGLGVLSLLVSAAGMDHRLWTSPASSMLGMLVLYMGWSWRRLHFRFRSLRRRTQALDLLPVGAFELASHVAQGSAPAGAPASSRRALDRATERLTQLQLLIDRAMSTMPVGVLICDGQGVIRAGNPAARELLLKADGEARSGDSDPLSGIALSSLLDRMESKHETTLRENEAQRRDAPMRFAGEYLTPNGRSLQLRLAPVGDDRASGYVVTLVDMSDEREAEREREEWRRFLSHDLRSPQVNILSLLSLRDEGVEVPHMFDAIRRESERTLSLAETFMDVATASSGRYHFTDVHLGALMADVCEQVNGYAYRQAVEVELNMGDAEEAMLQADGLMLRRAVVNLVNNAIRFSSRGSKVRICAAVDPSPGHEREADVAGSRLLVISVSDEGAGMDSGKWRALVAGSGVADTTTLRDVGTQYGFGWEIIRAVVRRHSGTIDGASAPGAGCTFWLFLPVATMA